MVIKKLENHEGNEIQGAFLEGVIMPNGEFISNGRSIWLKDEDNVFVREE